MCMRLLLTVILFLLPQSAWSYGDCVDGIPRGTGNGGENSGSCLCDTDIPRAPGVNVIWCEDWEANSLYYDEGEHPDVVVGNTSYPYGPPYDDTSSLWTNDHRGINAYMYRTYPTESPRSIYMQGEPSTVKLGAPCVGDGGQCFGMRIWRYDGTPTGKWDANLTYSPGGGSDESRSTPMVIIGDGDFADEVPTLADPVVPGLGAGVFDGHFSKAVRNEDCGPNGIECVNEGRAAGIHGRAIFEDTHPSGPAAYRTLGLTQAVAFASNVDTSGIWNQAWKMFEFDPYPVEGTHDILSIFNSSGDDTPGFIADRDNQRPFHLQFTANTGPSQCPAALAASTIRRGHVWCNDGSDTIFFRPRISDGYDWYQDFGPGKWGCVRTHVENAGTTNTTTKVWYNEQLIVDFTMDTSFTNVGNSTGYAAISLNNYANVNMYFGGQCGGQGGEACLDETTFRYQDNVVVTDGEPVTCEAIGFDFSGGPGPDRPAAPILLQ